MSKAYWNGVLSRLPDFCRNMGKTAMMGAMMADYNSHGHHHHCCCGPSIWGYGPGMGGGYYWNNMAGMGGMYPMGYYGGYQGGYQGGYMGQAGGYSGSQMINPNYIQARMNAIYSTPSSQAGSSGGAGGAGGADGAAGAGGAEGAGDAGSAPIQEVPEENDA